MSATRGSHEAARLIRVAHDGVEPHPPSPEARPYLEAFYALAALLPETELPPRLAAERMRRVARLAGHDPRAADEPEPTLTGTGEPPRPGRAGNVRRAGRAGTVAIPIAALVVLVVALVFVTTLLVLPRQEFSPENALYLFGTGAGSGARGVVLSGGEVLIVFASGLERLERGYRYVGWTVSEGVYERVGSLVALGAGRLRLQTRRAGPLSHFEVTIEPATATGQPVGPTVLAGFQGAR
ncbi:MAG: hypothetical protein ACOC1U_07125 [Spirochaetota bacterium]